jgi:hypothetical protein
MSYANEIKTANLMSAYADDDGLSARQLLNRWQKGKAIKPIAVASGIAGLMAEHRINP